MSELTIFFVLRIEVLKLKKKKNCSRKHQKRRKISRAIIEAHPVRANKARSRETYFVELFENTTSILYKHETAMAFVLIQRNVQSKYQVEE